MEFDDLLKENYCGSTWTELDQSGFGRGGLKRLVDTCRVLRNEILAAGA